MVSSERVAIVGIGGIFAGSPDLDRFWSNVVRGIDSTSMPPGGRWVLDVADAYDPHVAAPDRVYSTRAGFIAGFSLDPEGLELDRDLLADLDPVFHLALHAGRQAWLDSVTHGIDRNRVGVVLGNIVLPSEKSSAFAEEVLGRTFDERMKLPREDHAATEPLNVYAAGLPAGLLAQALGLKGGAYTLDAACASSLYAVKLAADELLAGRADAMLTGGLSRPDPLYTQMGFSQLRALSGRGKASPFDADADGLVVGEGAGMFVLKRLGDAVRAGDSIYGVIAGVGLSNDVHGGLLAPSSEGQLRAMRAAYAQAGWDPCEVDLIQCHATGTPVGDSVEFESLRTLWGERGWSSGQCVLGSVKSNIGHTLTASGSAGLLAALLALKHGQYPPTANFHTPPAAMRVDRSPFRILTEPEPWAKPMQRPRRAAVSGFGFGGINAHLLVEEWTGLPWSADRARASSRSSEEEETPIAIVGMAAHFGPFAGLRAFRERVLGGCDIEAPLGQQPWASTHRQGGRLPLTPPFRGDPLPQGEREVLARSPSVIEGVNTSPLAGEVARQRRAGEGFHEPAPSGVGANGTQRWWGVAQSAWFQSRVPNVSPQPFAIDHLTIELDRFRIPPRELEEMLPQQLLMLSVAADAIADAGWADEPRLRTGVFMGIELDLNTTNFHVRWSLLNKAREWNRKLNLGLSPDELLRWTETLRNSAGPPLTANRTMGALGGLVASRIAREFRVGGPSFTISSEATSGLRALAIAVRLLRQRELDDAIVGAVDFACDVRAVLASQGTEAIPADGAAALILKRHDDALRDGDRIYAVVRGAGAASGRVSPNAPDLEAYKSALASAFREAGANLATVGYLDSTLSHQEVEALTELFQDARDPVDCALGSTARDLGRPRAAAGLASLVKTVLCLNERILPPLRGEASNGAERTQFGIGLFAPSAPQYWVHDRARGPRTAAVGASSIDGNSLAVIVEATELSSPPAYDPQPLGLHGVALFAVEGADSASLIRELHALDRLAAECADAPIETLARVWFKQHPKDPAKPLGIAIVADSSDSLRTRVSSALRRLESGGRVNLDRGVYVSPDPSRLLQGRGERGPLTPPLHGDPLPQGEREVISRSPSVREERNTSPLAGEVAPRRGAGEGYRGPTPPRVDSDAQDPSARSPLGLNGGLAFVYPGVGNQFPGMGREISAHWPEILRAHDAENERLGSQLKPGTFWNSTPPESFADHRGPILGQVTLGTIVTDLLRKCGVVPNAAIGYSLGESAALFALRAWTDRDEMLRRLQASSLFRSDLAGACDAARREWGLPPDEPVRWVACVVPRPAAQVRAAMAGKERVYPLITNTPRECVIGGDRDAVAHVVQELGCSFVPLPIVSTVHCPIARQVEDDYRALHLLPTRAPAGVRFYSGASGRSYDVDRESAATAIVAQAVEGVDFNAVIERAYADGIRVFVEIGPGSSCTRMIGTILEGRPHLAVAACVPGQSEVATVLDVLARLIAERVPVDLSPLYGRDADGLEKSSNSSSVEGRTLRINIGGDPFRVPPIPVATRAPQPDPIHEPRGNGYSLVASAERLAPLPPAIDLTPLTREILARETANAEAHNAFLRASTSIAQTLSNQLAFQMALIESIAAGPTVVTEPVAYSPSPVLDRDMCLEFAVGSIGAVLGDAFAEIDAHPTRVRLPDEPLMLVDRIMTIEGEPRSLGSGRVVTEHDVLPGAWYLDGGRIPTCIAVESGQADLFLSGFLGIDFVTRGLAVYRLLDAVVTFHRALPGPGETIRYDIHIDHFFRQGDTHLFRFHFEATVGGEPLLSMRDGCAGFFTAEALAAGKGVVQTALQLRPARGIKPDDWEEFVPLEAESYDAARVDALRAGDLAGAFGPRFAGVRLADSIRLPAGRMKLVDRVTRFDPTGGRFGLGVIRAEADIDPSAWFLTCHFVDDRVMPGTLMYECCLHTLRIALMRMGWITDNEDAVWEPVPGVASRLKCRGQVTEFTRVVTYEVTLKELGYRPEPYAIADALMYADGKPIVEITDMALRLTGQTREGLRAIWGDRKSVVTAATPRVLYDREQILAFALGSLSQAFGERYRSFDEGRFIARLPAPPFSFLDRITSLNAEPWKMVAGGDVVGEYDVPPDAWYFEADRQAEMPFAVLIEVPLQVCGWFAAYLGSALTSEEPLKFRNLGGSAVKLRAVNRGSGTLASHVRITRVSHSAGMIIQHYEFETRDRLGPVYRGDTYFGFFREQALAEQVGIRDAALVQLSPELTGEARAFAYPREAPFPGDRWRMVQHIDAFAALGGPHRLGFIEGSAGVDPNAWFFKAHFYQDPVWPGSLGLESLLQLLKVVAIERWEVGPDTEFQTVCVGEPHRWSYRGQVIPSNHRVSVQAVVTRVDDRQRMLKADGFLSADGRVIYQLNDFTLGLGARG